MSNTLPTLVAGALTNVRNPRIDKDVISAGMLRDLEVHEDGRVSLTLVLNQDDPPGLAREIRNTVAAVDGVTNVDMSVVADAVPDEAPAACGTNHEAAPQPPPPDLSHLGTIIAVSSGKGGVGKSTVAANLAAALAKAGKRVGVMDADVYGPNLPRLFGSQDKPSATGGKVGPIERYGVKFISLGLLMDRDTPAIWRGPIVVKVIQQFLTDVDWGTLDYFIVDMPPGTGDAQLTLVQSAPVSGAVIVTTPQELAAGDSLRGAKMFEQVDVPVLGIIENMSSFACPHCGEAIDVFTEGGGSRLAAELSVPLLGRIPLQAGMAALADDGKPIVVAEPESPAAKTLVDITQQLMSKFAETETPQS
jgi:ATP-binding protein involved in chromosome partitioning